MAGVSVDECLDLVNHHLTVIGIRYAEPLGGRIQHLAGSLACLDKVVNQRRDIELLLQFLSILLHKLAESLLRILEILGCESPHVHRNGRMLVEREILAILGKDDLPVLALDVRALHYIGQASVVRP